jgi:hypothetical protein
MPVTKSPYNSFSAARDRNSGFVVRSVGEKVWLCDSHDTLFIQMMGGLDAGRGRFGFSGMGANSYEWLQDNNIATSVTTTAVSGALTKGADDAFGDPTYTGVGLTLAIDHPERLFRGMVVYANPPTGQGNIDGAPPTPEYMWVSSVDVAAKTATFVRGWRGTPAYGAGLSGITALPSGSDLCILTIVAEECHEFVLNPNTALSSLMNYWQVFVAGLSQSKRHKYIEHYGVGTGEEEYQRQMTRIMGGTIEGRKVTGELPRMLEQAILYGLPSPGGPSGDSSLGGINSFPINQVVVPTLSFDTIQDALEKALMNGANIGSLQIVTSPALQRQISGWVDGTVNRDRTETSVGTKVNTIVSDWGDVPVHWHRLLRANELYIVDFSEMGIIQMWEFTETRLGQTTSLCEDTMIDGCYGFALGCPCHHTRIRVDSTCITDGCVGPGCQQDEPVYVDPPTPGVPATLGTGSLSVPPPAPRKK